MTEENSANQKEPYPPGWNDPPMFNYESRTAITKGYSLNKRVGYSIDGNNVKPTPDQVNTSNKSAPSFGPPPCTSSLPPKTLGLLPKASDTEPPGVTEAVLNEPLSVSLVLENLNQSLLNITSDEHEKELGDIKRRLAIMEKMWTENKFPIEVQHKLYDISKALQDDKIETCDSLQRSLMVDYTSVCGTWMAGIRLLINLKRSLQH